MHCHRNPRRLYAAQPLHAGLVILIPAVDRILQQRLFKTALDELAILGEPVNRVIEVDLDGDDVTFAVYDLPSDGSKSSDGIFPNQVLDSCRR